MYRIITLSILLFSELAFSGNYLELGSQIQTVKYRELSSEGRQLINEEGQLIRVAGKYTFDISKNLGAAFELDRTEGNLDYEGENLLGTPLSTKTRHHFKSVKSSVFYVLNFSKIKVKPQLSLSDNYWSRNVARTESTANIQISRRWLGLDFGLLTEYAINSNWKFLLGMNYGETLSGQTTLDLSDAGLNSQKADSNVGKFYDSQVALNYKGLSSWQIAIGYSHSKITWQESEVFNYEAASLSLIEPELDLKAHGLFLALKKPL